VTYAVKESSTKHPAATVNADEDAGPPPAPRLFLVVGLLCLVATLIFAWLGQETLLGLLPALFAEGALIFISALLIERRLLTDVSESGHRRTEKLTRAVTTSIDQFFRTEFDVLKYADQYNVSILPPRRSMTKNPNTTYLKMEEAISRAKEVRLFCTSGVDFFPSPTAPSIVRDTIRRKAMGQESFSLSVLSAAPDSEYVTVRGTLENAATPDYIATDLAILAGALKQIERAATPGFAVRWHTYSFIPQAWFLITEAEAFVEVYHFGLGRRDPTDPNSCVGGRVPVFHASAGSGLYQALSEYFDYLVTPNVNSKSEQIRTRYFGIKACPLSTVPTVVQLA
jgi:hypothetical protein